VTTALPVEHWVMSTVTAQIERSGALNTPCPCTFCR
jgi:hypothetical protein